MKDHHNYYLVNHPSYFIFSIFIILVLVTYFYFGKKAATPSKKWPFYRYICWLTGLSCITASTIGPLARNAHHNFVFHMITHLLLGMLAPLLIVLAAPSTLLLRSLNIHYARRVSRFLRSSFFQMISNPLIAALFNTLGLWLLYTSTLYNAIHQNIVLHIIVHIHIFLAGYLFTLSMIYVDPTPHPYSYRFRSIILVLSLASHEILSKYIYAHPPSTISTVEGRIGGELMYYGGDIIELMIIFLLCFKWFKSSQPREHKAFS